MAALVPPRGPRFPRTCSEAPARPFERLAELGPPGALPAPFDRIEKNLNVMRADLDAHEQRLVGVEAKVAERAAPIGIA